MNAIKTVPLFAGASGDRLKAIAAVADEVMVQPGMSLATQGKQGDELMVVLSGSAEVVRDGKHLAELGPGDFFGEISLLDGGPRTATVTAKEPMRTLVVRKSDFSSVQSNAPGVSGVVMVELAKRLRDLSDFYTL